ncbi:hypothetical protein HRbin20_00979 [bacterium HR20]|nr:hypothetical protein HRbin20_00979 [bacterium HR20]
MECCCGKRLSSLDDAFELFECVRGRLIPRTAEELFVVVRQREHVGAELGNLWQPMDALVEQDDHASDVLIVGVPASLGKNGPQLGNKPGEVAFDALFEVLSVHPVELGKIEDSARFVDTFEREGCDEFFHGVQFPIAAWVPP